MAAPPAIPATTPSHLRRVIGCPASGTLSPADGGPDVTRPRCRSSCSRMATPFVLAARAGCDRSPQPGARDPRSAEVGSRADRAWSDAAGSCLTTTMRMERSTGSRALASALSGDRLSGCACPGFHPHARLHLVGWEDYHLFPGIDSVQDLRRRPAHVPDPDRSRLDATGRHDEHLPGLAPAAPATPAPR